MSVSQEIYTRSNGNKKQLYLLCLGLLDRTGGDPLFDLEAPIWRRASKRRELKPTRPELAHEVHRRDQSQKCANWPLQRSVDFLLANPIANPADISFLRNEVDRLKLLITRVQQEDVEGAAGGSPWRGHAPYMRLIMCLACDDVKAASEDPTSTRAIFYVAEAVEIGDEIVTLQGKLILTPPTTSKW